MMGFATFWTAFVAFWTAGALGVFCGGGIRPENALFAAFSTPFWIVGFLMLGSALWMARGTRMVYLDASVAYTELRCLVWRRRRTIDRNAVQHARKGAAPVRSSNADTPFSAEIVYEKGLFRIPCTSEPELNWLIDQINDFLASTPYRPAYSSA